MLKIKGLGLAARFCVEITIDKPSNYLSSTSFISMNSLSGANILSLSQHQKDWPNKYSVDIFCTSEVK